jgi:putative membrane protein
MTLPVERSRTRRPVTWITLVGVLLLPVVIGGLLVAALYNPAERLENMTAAIVNDDDPVELDGQVVPLGRQLTAGLVTGSDDVDSNIDWTISNDEDAAAGLADGTYSAVITIPTNFSAAATSTAPGSVPEQATIEVQTAPDGRIVDDAITAQITQTAASVFGEEVSKSYLTNVLLGFTTLHDQLGDAASGAAELADGADQAADGATQLADGTGQLADGVGGLAGGAAGIADGASQLADGASQAATGLDQLSGAAGTLAGGTDQIATALGAIAGQIPSDLPQVPADVIQAARDVAANSDQINQQLTDAANELAALAAQCDPALTPELCTGIDAAAARADEALGTATGIVDQAGLIADGLEGINALPQLGAGLAALSAETRTIAQGMQGVAGGITQAGDGVRQLGTGASALGDGALQLGAGAATAASGADELATGADALATGVAQLATGTHALANGLDTAVAEIPDYTDDEAQDLAAVVADPVAAGGVGANLFGASAIPLLAMLVLWFGGLGTFVVLRAVSARALSSRRSSAMLTLRAFAPAAIIGALQGILVAVVVQISASYSWADWSLFAALCILAGVAFAAVNQALVALFGGAGRWIAAVIGALTLATGIVSTVPAVLLSVAALLPTAPAYGAMLAALTPAGGITAGVVGMLVWAVLALVVTTIVVSQRRKASLRATLAASGA